MIDGGKVMRAVKREVKNLIQCFSLQGRGEELKRKKKVRSIPGTINNPVRESALNFAIFTFLHSYFNAHLL